MLAALCLASVFAVSLSSYMTLCYTTLNVSNKNLGTSRGIELAEAGMEQALWSLDNSSWTGWTTSGSTARKTVSGFSYESGASGQFALTVTNYNTGTPTLTSVGSVTLADGSVQSRTLTSSAAPSPEFVNAIGANGGTIVFSNGGTVDSYDSSVAPYSSGTATAKATLLSTSTSTSSANIQLNSITLKGYAVTSTGTSVTHAVGANLSSASILTKAAPYQPIFTENTAGGGTAYTGQTTIGFSTDTTPRVYYSNSNVNITSKVTVNGPVILVINGNLTLTNNGQFALSNTQVSGKYVASLELHVEGSLSLGGKGINNATLIPKRVAVVGTSGSGSSTVTISTTQAFYGVVYFPNEPITISSSILIYGSVVGKSVSLTASSPAIHYDLSLQNTDTTVGDAAFNCVTAPYAISSYSE